MKFCYDLAAESRNTKGGVLSPGMSLLRPVRVFLNKVLPDNAHIIAKDRLFVSVTDFCTNKNKLICQFKSKKHLIKVSSRVFFLISIDLIGYCYCYPVGCIEVAVGYCYMASCARIEVARHYHYFSSYVALVVIYHVIFKQQVRFFMNK